MALGTVLVALMSCGLVAADDRNDRDDAAHRVQAHAAPAAIDVRAVHLVPEVLGHERVLADHDVRQARGGGVRERPLDRPLHGHRGGVNLANARYARVGRHLNLVSAFDDMVVGHSITIG